MGSEVIKIALGCIHFPLSMASYFMRAFKRRDDIELWTFGPFTGDWTPWAYGLHLPQKYVVTPDFALPANTIRTIMPSAMINQNMPWTPDLTLFIDAGYHTSDRPAGRIVGLIETDPHVLRDNYKLPKTYCDIAWCMQAKYIESDEEYLPYGFDPTVHYPMDLEKIYDACLIGLQYPQRNELVGRLRGMGLNVYYTIGEVYDEYRERYNQSKVALSWSTLEDTPARVFEAFGLKRPLVANRTEDLQNLFLEENDYLGFSSTDEAVKQAFRILTDDDLANTIAENGHKKATAKHTWDHRVEQILKKCELI